MFLFNVCKQCTDVVLAHILSCCKTWVRVFVWWEQPADLWKMSCHLQSYTFTAMAGVCLLPWTAQTHQPELTKPILLENRGHFQQVISKSWGGPGRSPSPPPPPLMMGGWSARCRWPGRSIWLAVAKRQHMPMWLEWEPAKTAGLREGMAHTRNTDSCHLFPQLPPAS